MAKLYEIITDNGAANRVRDELNLYIDSIKEDIAYEELDKNVERDKIIDELIQYYTLNPMDDTMSYDDWVDEFIDSNNLRDNIYKSQMKDYLRNIVTIIYNNMAKIEDDNEKTNADNESSKVTKYTFAEFITISDNASTFRMRIAQNGNISRIISNVPVSVGKSFKDRDLLLDRATERLQSTGRMCLEDTLCGTGKTSFAKELFHHVANKYNHIAWIRLDGSFRQSMLDSFSIYPATTDSEIRYAQIMAFLKTKRKKFCFFIDNSYGVSMTEDEYNFLNQFKVDVCFVNDPHFESVGVDLFRVTRFSIEQCIDVFYEYYTLDKAHKFIDIVEEFVELADRNTYMIKVLAKSAKGYNLAEFLHRLKTDGFVYNDLAGLDSDTASMLMGRNLIKLMKTLNVTDKQYNILKYFTIMPVLDIPVSIINALNFEKADLDRLESFGLIDCFEKVNYGTVYSIHPIMRKTVHLMFDIKPKDARLLINVAINGNYIKEDESFASFMTKLKIANGLLVSMHKQRFDEKCELYNAVGCWFYSCGEYGKALELFKKAVNIREKIPVINHPATAIVYDNVTRAYNATEDYDSAIEFGGKALYIYQQYNDTYIKKIASISVAIGDAYFNKSEFDTALTYYNDALKIREKGEPDLNLAEIYSKIGSALNEKREPEKAIEYHTKAMKIKEKLLGQDSPITAMTYNSLALIYKEQSDFDKALDFNNKTLKIRERVLGTEHPLTAKTYNHLGRIYLNKNDFDKALEFYVKAYKIFKHIYGDQYPMTRLVYDNLEATYRRSFEKWLAEHMK